MTMGWLAGYSEFRKGMGHIYAEEKNGRRYYFARVTFPRDSGWWDRTTETSNVDDARDWVDEQVDDWKAHCPLNSRDAGDSDG